MDTNLEKGKFVFSLNRDSALHLKELLKQLGLPRTHFSVLLDEHIRTLIPLITEMVERKRVGEKLTVAELVGMIPEVDEKTEI